MMAFVVAVGSVMAEETAPAAAAPAAAPVVAPAPAAPAPAPAAAPAAPVVKRDKPVLQDLELVGKVVQQEKVGKNKEGAEVKQTITVLEIAADGIQVVIPKAKNIDPTTFVGKEVKVFGKGTTEVNKKGKKSIRLMKLEKIEPVAP